MKTKRNICGRQLNRININGADLEYCLERKRVKNINVRIKPEGIFVSAGYKVALEYIERFLISKAEFIFNAMKKYSDMRYSPMNGLYEEGEEVYILGRIYKVTLNRGRNGVRLEQERIMLSCGNPADCALRQRIVNNWFRELCMQAVLKGVDKVYGFFQARGIEYPQISLRRMRARWGSCQPCAGRILFNTALIHVPEKCIDYVAAHELAHFLQPDHSKKFYQTLEEVMPDWRERKKLLEEYGRAVII